MSFLEKYIKKYWKLFALAVSCLMLEALCDLMQPTIMSKVVDKGVESKNMNYVIHYGALMLGVTVIGALAAIVRNIVSVNVSQRFGAELRGDLFKKIQGFSFDNINQFEGATLVTRLTNDVTQVQNFINGLMRIFVKAPLLCIGSIVMAVRLNPQMSLILVVIVPIIGLLIICSMKIGYPFYSKVQKSLDNVNSIIREYLSGVRVVKAFNRFDFEVNRFERQNDNLMDVSTRAMRVMTVFSPGIALIVNIGIVLVLWIGGIRVNTGKMQVGQIIAFINYMTQILNSLMMISMVFNMFVRAKASAERIWEVFLQENTISTSKNSENYLVDSGMVSFKDVSFSFLGTLGEPVIKNISFSCNSGETIGIIGSTGAGKSTLVNLIPRFYDVCEGSIEIDDIDIRKIEAEKLRDEIAIVPQKTMLFIGNIIENIRWGKEDASAEEVEKAARISEAHEFISAFPEGYNTILGQGGVNLSGGQKQRISIARALVKKPKILILDDCTSAVDVSTEFKIREQLKSYINNLTCFIIAQRITSVMGADKIIVLEDGKIVGQGSHEVLIKDCDVYRDIYRSQIGNVNEKVSLNVSSITEGGEV